MDDYLKTLDPALLQRELELERECWDMSPERYERLVRGREEAETHPGRIAMRRLLPRVVEALEEYLRECDAGLPKRSATIAHILAALPVETVAFLSLQHLINHLHGSKYTRVCSFLGRRLLQVQVADAVKAADPDLYKRYLKAAKRGTLNEGRLVILLKRFSKRAGVKEVPWGQEDTIRLAALVLDLTIEATGIAVVEDEGSDPYASHGNSAARYGRTKVIRPTESAARWFRESHAKASLTMPLCYPMLVPPAPWAPGVSGGYLMTEMREHRGALVTGGVQQAYLAELADRDMPAVYASINAAQETAWVIHPTVYRVASELVERGLGEAGLPPAERIQPPERPEKPEQVTEESRRVWREWLAAAALADTMDHERTAKLMRVINTLTVARRFKDEDAIYFPHRLDFRGRVYSSSLYLTPQGNDLDRGLLTFAKAVPLGPDGQFWLAVHLANCYGVDKLAYEDRVAWTEEHEGEILASALDPLANRWWMDADKGTKPWQMLAACVEWLRMRMWERSGKPVEEFPSSLPVGWDGTCNGLQHYSAMLRDPVGGRFVNLTPAEKPSDIYARVAEVASRIVGEDADDTEDETKARYAQSWIGRVSRGIAKRPTMTFPYGASRFGYTEQIFEELMKLPDDYLGPPVGDVRAWKFRRSIYLADVMLRAVPEVVRAADEAMRWLAESAKVVAGAGVALSWSTPTGFIVRQNYKETVGKELDITVLGKRRTICLQVEKMTEDKRKHAAGVAPNFVHSLDAAHLALTVQAGVSEGITSWSLVHDSYGAHAGNATRLHEIIREQFVEMYREHDVLGQFARDLGSAVEYMPEARAKLKAPPRAGSLVLDAVLDSRYFFS